MNCNTLVKIQIKEWLALFQNLQSSVDCSMERLIRYKFSDLESIQHKISSDHHYTFIISQLWSRTPGTSREIYSKDADGETRTCNPSVINQVLQPLN